MSKGSVFGVSTGDTNGCFQTSSHALGQTLNLTLSYRLQFLVKFCRQFCHIWLKVLSHLLGDYTWADSGGGGGSDPQFFYQ